VLKILPPYKLILFDLKKMHASAECNFKDLKFLYEINHY